MTISSQVDAPDPGRRALLKHGVCGTLGLLASSCLPGAGCSLRRAKQPNVVLMVLDTARADRFSFMGYRHPTSPSIDALAAESAVYAKAFSTAFWTLPSHATLFTGKYPSEVGATSETNALPPSAHTLASVLREAGYDTGAFVCNPWINTWRGFGQGFRTFVDAWKGEDPPGEGPGAAVQPEQTAMRRAIEWIDGRENREGPFFAFLNLNRAHLPYEPESAYRHRFLGADRDPDRVRALTLVKGMWEFLGGALQLDETDFEILNELYDGEIANVDAYVGQFADFLRARRRLDNTLFMVTSDHGENIGDHGLIDHLLSMYDTTLHVPLLVRYPERFAAGTRGEELVSLLDVVPTVLDVCGLAGALPGVRPALRSLCSPDRAPSPFIVAENGRPLNGVQIMRSRFPAFDAAQIDHQMRALRTERHKLIWREGVGTEFYDLEADPGETTNLATQVSDEHDRLMEALDAWRRATPALEAAGANPAGDPQSLEVLRSLGYVK